MSAPFWVAIDIETTGLDFTTDVIRGVGIFTHDHSVFHTDIADAKSDIETLRHHGAKFVLQNAKFDVKFLRKAGIELKASFDTLLAARLLKERPQKLSLDSLASFYLGLPSWKGDVAFDTEDMDALANYCLQDCEVTLQLREILEAKLREEGRYEFFSERLMPAARLMADAEYGGICVDWGQVSALKGQLSGEADVIRDELTALEAPLISAWQYENAAKRAAKTKNPEKNLERYRAAPSPFNWASPAQVLWMLKAKNADVMTWDAKKRTNVESSNDDVLQKNAAKIPFAAKLSELRTREKLMGALDGYSDIKSKDTGRIHCNFNLHVTETGRLSSSNPNLQNVDRSNRVRGLFIPSVGYKLLVADLAQIEVRMAAHYSRDPRLIEMFEKGEDFYGTIACEILGANCTPNEVKTRYPDLRKVAKVIGLSILYGTGAARLASTIERDTGIPFTLHQAREVIRAYFKRFEGLTDLRMRVDRKLTKDGYLTSLFGRKLDIAGDDIYMCGVNYLLQSSASDLMLFRQIEIEKAARAGGFDQRLVSLVHDELLREIRPEQAGDFVALVKSIMERTDDIECRVPIKIECELGDSWACKS